MQQGPPRARAASSSSTRRRAASSPTTRSRPSSPQHAAVPGVARRRASCTSTTCRRSSRSCRSTARRCSSSACSATRRKTCDSIIAPMARNAVESLGSMGTDTPVPVISDRPRMLYEYFKQLFAQVDEPAARRQLRSARHVAQLVDRARGQPARPRSRLVPPDRVPVRRSSPTRSWRSSATSTTARPRCAGFTPFTVYCHYPVAEGGDGLRMAIDNVRTQVSEAIADGANLIILSDRYADAESAPIPALLVTAARAPPSRAREDAHARRPRRRDRRGARGAPLRAAARLRRRCDQPVPRVRHDPRPAAARACSSGLTERKAVKNYVKAAGKGILKVMSKMGISTVASYTGAQIFEAVGLQKSLVDEYFTGTASRIEGIDLDVIATEVAAAPPHRVPRPPRRARAPRAAGRRRVPVAARRASTTSSTPTPCSSCSTRRAAGRYDVFKEYTRLVDNQAKRLATLRGLFELKTGRARAGADRRGRAGRRRS